MTCRAKRRHDQMCCDLCGLQWDVDDTDRPECRTGHGATRAILEKLAEPSPDKRCGNCQHDEGTRCAHGRWELGKSTDAHHVQLLKNFNVSKCVFWEEK